MSETEQQLTHANAQANGRIEELTTIVQQQRDQLRDLRHEIANLRHENVVLNNLMVIEKSQGRVLNEDVARLQRESDLSSEHSFNSLRKLEQTTQASAHDAHAQTVQPRTPPSTPPHANRLREYEDKRKRSYSQPSGYKPRVFGLRPTQRFVFGNGTSLCLHALSFACSAA
jgi:hypothetical protein